MTLAGLTGIVGIGSMPRVDLPAFGDMSCFSTEHIHPRHRVHCLQRAFVQLSFGNANNLAGHAHTRSHQRHSRCLPPSYLCRFSKQWSSKTLMHLLTCAPLYKHIRMPCSLPVRSTGSPARDHIIHDSLLCALCDGCCDVERPKCRPNLEAPCILADHCRRPARPFPRISSRGF